MNMTRSLLQVVDLQQEVKNLEEHRDRLLREKVVSVSVKVCFRQMVADALLVVIIHSVQNHQSMN